MITDEQARAAAERLRRWDSGELPSSIYGPGDGPNVLTPIELANNDAWDLARRYIAEHRTPPDDGPITAEWCREHGSEVYRDGYREWVVGESIGGVYPDDVVAVNGRRHFYGCTRSQLLALLSVLRGEPSGQTGQLQPLSKPEALPLASGQQVWIVGRVLFDASQPAAHGVSPWTFQGVFLTREKAVAACRDWHYFIAPVTIGEPFPHAPSAMPCAEFPAVNAVDLSKMIGQSAPPPSSIASANPSPEPSPESGTLPEGLNLELSHGKRESVFQSMRHESLIKIDNPPIGRLGSDIPDRDGH